MTCREFNEILTEIIDGGQTIEQEMHWKSCRECSDLVNDLTLISQQAMMLRAVDTPSARVWNSIEIALRQEGLIHQGGGLSVVAMPGRRWSMQWLVPVAAAFLLSFGVVDYYMAYKQQPRRTPMAVVAQPVTVASAMDADDSQMLEAIGLSAPAMRATYEANLRDVNAFIRDAEDSAKNNPGDEEAQQALVEAYAQKNMIYEMATDRTLR